MKLTVVLRMPSPCCRSDAAIDWIEMVRTFLEPRSGRRSTKFCWLRLYEKRATKMWMFCMMRSTSSPWSSEPIGKWLSAMSSPYFSNARSRMSAYVIQSCSATAVSE